MMQLQRYLCHQYLEVLSYLLILQLVLDKYYPG